MPSEDVSLLKSLLNPHKCYLNEVYSFIKEFGYDNIHGMCHVTGGGFYQNMERVLPEGLSIELNNKIVFPLWATILQNKLNIDTEEMMKVYNCGLGFILIIDSSIRESLIKLNFDFEIIGSLINK
jgi:phosphoribosylformylglycinamidine cyclo-ligase